MGAVKVLCRRGKAVWFILIVLILVGYIASEIRTITKKEFAERSVLLECTDNSNSYAVVQKIAEESAAGLYLVFNLSAGPDAVSYPIQHLDSMPRNGWTDEYKTTKLVLRKIPSGTFTMGCNQTEIGYLGLEAIPHKVSISKPFYIGVFEVTQKQYELVTGNKPSKHQGDMRPVECVSWNTIRGNSSTYDWPRVSNVDPLTFMGKLRAKTGIGTFDLPTEAMWEYACRAGTTTALNSGKNLTQPLRDLAMDEVGRYGYNNGYQKGGRKDGRGGYLDCHTTVGSYKPNAWGLYDMHGNVWEWCLDWYQDRNSFSSVAVVDPVGPNSGPARMARGGGWYIHAKECRSSYRVCYNPERKYHTYGFRICCSVEH